MQAAREVNVSVPVVARLAGTNVEEGRRILHESGLPIVTADGLAEAAQAAVTALHGSRESRDRAPAYEVAR